MHIDIDTDTVIGVNANIDTQNTFVTIYDFPIAHCPTQTCPDGGFLDQNCQCLCPGDIYGNPIKLCGTPDIKVDSKYWFLSYQFC